LIEMVYSMISCTFRFHFEPSLARGTVVSRAPSGAAPRQCLLYAKRRIDRSFDYRISI